MVKVITTICLDQDLLMEIKRISGFNLSGFCNTALKSYLNVKNIEISNEEAALNTEIAETTMKLQLMQQKQQELIEAREKEEKRFISYEEWKQRQNR